MLKYSCYQNRATCFTLFVLAFHLLIGSAFADIRHLVIPAPSLKDSNRIVIATPESFDFDRKTKYPFIIMLHGWSGDETQWEEDADLQLLSNQYDVLLVLPDGGYDGWWLDSPSQEHSHYDSHIHDELIPWIIKHYNGSEKAKYHGILGLSMGGYGSLLQIFKHPKTYRAAVSLSGIMDITRHTGSWSLTNVLGSFTDNEEIWLSHNPMHLSQKPAPRYFPDILLICGRDDFAFEENQVIAHQMERTGYTVNFREETGSHTHEFWKAHVTTAVHFIIQMFNKN